jgi:hypothetical protein
LQLFNTGASTSVSPAGTINAASTKAFSATINCDPSFISPGVQSFLVTLTCRNTAGESYVGVEEFIFYNTDIAGVGAIQTKFAPDANFTLSNFAIAEIEAGICTFSFDITNDAPSGRQVGVRITEIGTNRGLI